MKKVGAAIPFLVLLFCSCCLYNTVKLPEGGYRPKCNDFEFAKNPYHIQPGDVIDTNAIYLEVKKNDFKQRASPDVLDKYYEQNKEKIEADSVYWFIRFFSNGRAFSFTTYNYPTNIDINNIWAGTVGYYRLEGNKITLETFVPLSSGNFDMVVGDITNDSLRFTKRLSTMYGYRPTYDDTTYFAGKVKEPWMKFLVKPDW